MSPLKSSETPQPRAAAGPRRKAPADLYTVFLVIALVAILLGILFLYLELSVYEFKLEGAPMAYQQSATSHQLSAIGSQPSAISGQHGMSVKAES